MCKVIAYLKQNGKTVGYRVSNGKDYTVEQLIKAISDGLFVSNVYLRKGGVVLKSKQGVDSLVINNPIYITDFDTRALRKIDSAFMCTISFDSLDNTMLRMIREIDGVVPEKNVRETGRFKSKFGVLDLYFLSSGCKTALLVYKAQLEKRKQIISLNSAGVNAIKVICDYLSRCVNQYPLLELTKLPMMYNDELEHFIFYDVNYKYSGSLFDIMSNRLDKEV